MYSNSLKKVVRIIARIMKKWELSKAGIEVTKDALGDPSAADLEAAERIVLLSAMFETKNAEEKGKLASLCPKRDGGLIVSCVR